jgi:hypothetical protein
MNDPWLPSFTDSSALDSLDARGQVYQATGQANAHNAQGPACQVK